MTECLEGKWLPLVRQISPKPAYLRVKIWRRLQALGAVAIKNSVYVIPKDEARLDWGSALFDDLYEHFRRK